IKESVNPSKLGGATVDHFSLPAFDSGARPERVAASTIMSNKLKVPKSAILLSRLNPRFNRTWWASAGTETSALASTEFLVLTSEDALELAAVWLAVRDSFFREELPKRVTGTSGSHQRVRPDDVLAIEVPDFRGASLKVKQLTLGLLMRADSLRIESDRLTALRDVLLPDLLSGRMQVPVGGDASLRASTSSGQWESWTSLFRKPCSPTTVAARTASRTLLTRQVRRLPTRRSPSKHKSSRRSSTASSRAGARRSSCARATAGHGI